MAETKRRGDVRNRIGPKQTGGVSHVFTKAASRVSEVAGNHWTFLLMVMIIVVWALTGPIFNFSDSWQLFINSATTLITFLMVFIIQNTQNRDAKAMHLKLDELLRAVPQARKAFMDVEDEDLNEIAREKEIVDKDDPYPPDDKQRNGRPKARSADRE